MIEQETIPFVDLRAQNDEVRDEILAAFRAILDDSSFVGGRWVETFENDFARFLGCRQVVACANGTDGLRLGLAAAGVQPGDEVVTVAHTFIATAEACTLIGATPRFVDIDPRYYTMSPVALQTWLDDHCDVRDGATINRQTGRRVAAVIPVHLYGQVADLPAILDIVGRYPLAVVEDACQAHGAWVQLKGGPRRAGTVGVAGAFSFYPAKNLGALGEGGAVATDDPEVAARMQLLRSHGEIERYVHSTALGWNSRLASVQAAALALKLPRLEAWTERRRRVAAWYAHHLADCPAVMLPEEASYGTHVYHLYVIRVRDRDRVRAELADRGIATGLHYPIPLHLQAAYAHLELPRGSLPVTERVAETIISLPMFPHLAEVQVAHVCRQVADICRSLDPIDG